MPRQEGDISNKSRSSSRWPALLTTGEGGIYVHVLTQARGSFRPKSSLDLLELAGRNLRKRMTLRNIISVGLPNEYKTGGQSTLAHARTPHLKVSALAPATAALAPTR